MSKTIGFNVSNKIVLIIGGASGLGIELVRECLRRGAKGVGMADISEREGKKWQTQLQQEYGESKICYIKMDVTNKTQVDATFSAIILYFKYLDIVINTAGVFDDNHWESSMLINFNGCINVILFALHYLKNNISTDSGLLILFSSSNALEKCPSVPLYSAAKLGVVSMARSFGHPKYFEQTKIRVIAIAPGLTESPILLDYNSRCLTPVYARMNAEYIRDEVIQKIDYLLESTFDIINSASTGSIWVIKDNAFSFEFRFERLL